jgi:5-methylcytosine-specific restriction endonuclease McrA
MKKNIELREKFKKMKCMACGYTPCDCDHILNSCGLEERETELNCWPLCRKCHTEKGNIGRVSFIEKYNLGPEMYRRGFRQHAKTGKWYYPKVEK